MIPFRRYIADLFLTPPHAGRVAVLHDSGRLQVIRFVRWSWQWPVHVSLQRSDSRIEPGRMLFIRLGPVTFLFAWADALEVQG